MYILYITLNRNHTHTQAAEITKLNHIISEADTERAAMKKEYDQVINERDILGTQVYI